MAVIVTILNLKIAIANYILRLFAPTTNHAMLKVAASPIYPTSPMPKHDHLDPCSHTLSHCARCDAVEYTACGKEWGWLSAPNPNWPRTHLIYTNGDGIEIVKSLSACQENHDK